MVIDRPGLHNRIPLRSKGRHDPHSHIRHLRIQHRILHMSKGPHSRIRLRNKDRLSPHSRIRHLRTSRVRRSLCIRRRSLYMSKDLCNLRRDRSDLKEEGDKPAGVLISTGCDDRRSPGVNRQYAPGDLFT
jgi:hypothetical protein